MKSARQKRLIANRVRLLERMLIRQATLAAELGRVNRRIHELDDWLDAMWPGRGDRVPGSGENKRANARGGCRQG